MENNSEHQLRQHWQHWKMTIAGSAIGFTVLIIDLFYMYLTNRLPSLAKGEIVEIILIVIPLFIFAWFLRMGIWEYEEIKEELNAAKKEVPK